MNQRRSPDPTLTWSQIAFIANQHEQGIEPDYAIDSEIPEELPYEISDPGEPAWLSSSDSFDCHHVSVRRTRWWSKIQQPVM